MGTCRPSRCSHRGPVSEAASAPGALSSPRPCARAASSRVPARASLRVTGAFAEEGVGQVPMALRGAWGHRSGGAPGSGGVCSGALAHHAPPTASPRGRPRQVPPPARGTAPSSEPWLPAVPPRGPDMRVSPEPPTRRVLRSGPPPLRLTALGRHGQGPPHCLRRVCSHLWPRPRVICTLLSWCLF